MYVLKDNGVIKEIESGNNFGYVLQDSKYFVKTDYKVLQSQKDGLFVTCMKMMYNGKIELYYITDNYRPMSSMFANITPEILITIVVNLFGSVVDVRNNGFLKSQNIDVSWDKIFVDTNTLQVKLVYLPINVNAFDSYAEFESELRASLVKLINRLVTQPHLRLDKMVADIVNGSLSIEDIYNKYRGAGVPAIDQYSKNEDTKDEQSGELKIVAMNAPEYFEAKLGQAKTVFGKKRSISDVVIDFNAAISRKHCSIYCHKGKYFIEDEDSANGTYVNGKRLSASDRIEIKKGDIIRMADSDFQLVSVRR